MKDRNNFTLIELLVVIAIIAILAGILLPALNKAKQKSQAVDCLAKLKQSMTAVIAYTDTFSGYFVCHSPWAEMVVKYAGSNSTKNYKAYRCPVGKIADNSSPYQTFGIRMVQFTTQIEVTNHNFKNVRKPSGYIVLADSLDTNTLRQNDRIRGRQINDNGVAISNTEYGNVRFRIDFRHSLRTNIGFADGHAEGHRFRDSAEVYKQCILPYPTTL